MSPAFSLIIPTYQGLSYLDQAVHSVLDQTNPDWECWLIDDASPDATGECVDWWARQDGRIHALHQPTNGGVLAARNRAIAASQGTWIKPLDQDDRLHPEALALLSAASRVQPDAVAISLTAQAVDESGQVQGRYQWVSQDQVWSGPQFVAANLLGFNPTWVPSCHAYRRTAWAAVGGYRDPGPQVRHRDWGTDWELLWRIGTQGPVVTLATVAVDYRLHSQQVSQQRFGYAEIFMRAQLLTAFFAEHPETPSQLAALAWGRHWAAGLLMAAQAWQQGDEALALYTLDQLRTFPGPYGWEDGVVLADVLRWMDAIRHHHFFQHGAATAQSHTVQSLLRTGWAINPATVSELVAHPEWLVYGTAAQLAVLATVWPTLHFQVASEPILRAQQPTTITGAVLPPPSYPGPLWVAEHLETPQLWPLVV